jgi:hypothetical protein
MFVLFLRAPEPRLSAVLAVNPLQKAKHQGMRYSAVAAGHENAVGGREDSTPDGGSFVETLLM